MSFIHDIDENEDGAAIVNGIIALARKLNLTVLGEGVETESQRRFLAEQDCDLLQGFLISHALPAPEFEQFIRTWTPAQ
jgi:EAL domain-containing protein (putative c-di-GMP-specific phosphodiesterase class I)